MQDQVSIFSIILDAAFGLVIIVFLIGVSRELKITVSAFAKTKANARTAARQ